MTALSPDSDGSVSRSSIRQPSGVHDTGPGRPICTLPTLAGQSGGQIAAALAAAIQAPGIPGPHPQCPADRNSRDIALHGASLISVHATSLELCTDDPNLGFDLRSEELANAHPVADAGGDRAAPTSPVTLDASASSDPDSTPGTQDDLESYAWYEVSGGSPLRARPMRRAIRSRMCSASSGMSLVRSRSGGTGIGRTFSR